MEKPGAVALDAAEARYTMTTEPVNRALLLRLHACLIAAADQARRDDQHDRVFALSVALRELEPCLDDCAFLGCPPEVARGVARLAESVLTADELTRNAERLGKTMIAKR